MSRRVVITGLGPVSGCGLGIEPNWEAVRDGRSAISTIEAFDPGGFDCRIGAEIREFKIRDFVPKSYRKATKVMARDIELAVAAADLAARDGGLATPGTDPDAEQSYPSHRIGCHIGAGLIAADPDELTAALTEARSAEGQGPFDFDIHKWGAEGMNHLTPLWLLKYLPNMLACHVTIIHDTHGPSNTITCGEASGELSIGESLRVIQRDKADICFCGGAESRLNPMAHQRQEFAGRMTAAGNPPEADPSGAVRPFDRGATGTASGEGGGIVLLESLDSFKQRAAGNGRNPYAEVVGFGAAQTVHRPTKNRKPDPQGRGIAAAIGAALHEAGIGPDAIDLLTPFGLGSAEWDEAETAAMRAVFGDRLAQIPVTGIKAITGNCGAGAGGLELSIAARAMADQTVPTIANRPAPIDGIGAGTSEPNETDLGHALVFSTGIGGQNAAIVIKSYEP